jgi:hypothetical protein
VIDQTKPKTKAERRKLMPASGVGPKSILQVRVSLEDSSPEIWRRLLVPGHIKLLFFHRILQIAMGWTDTHLHEFQIRGKSYGPPEPEGDALSGEQWEDDERFALYEVIHCLPARFTYTYDMGDGWEHDILIEKVVPRTRGAQYPRCIEGARACPPEDCGGIYGYEEFLEALDDPKHERHEELLGWIGRKFDPEAFDIGSINEELRHYKELPPGYFEDF